MGYAGADWIERSFKVKCSPVGRAAADLLGDVFQGIYHMEHGALKRADWTDPHYIAVTTVRDLANVDGCELMVLCVLASDRMLRVEISGVAPGRVRIGITQRSVRSGDLFRQCPTIEAATANIRKHYDSTPVDNPPPQAHP